MTKSVCTAVDTAVFNILEFGAVGDGETLNTKAIQNAVDACAAAGGGTVVVPRGVFVSGTVFLKSNMTFKVEDGGVLFASGNMADYCSDDAFPQNAVANAEGWRGAHLLVILEQHNVTITGPGTINGNCNAFYCKEQRMDIPCAGTLAWARGLRVTDGSRISHRPGQMLAFIQSRNIRIHDINLQDSPCWTLFFHGCSEVLVRGAVINNPIDGINTDGIDIDCCTQVTVSDCIIRTGDDAITLRASGKRLIDHPDICEDIAITNCVLDCSVCAFRLGVGEGTIRNAVISNISIRNAGMAVLVQSSFGREGSGATIREITFNNIRGHHIGDAIWVIAGAENTGEAQLRNIRFDNCHLRCCGRVTILGNDKTRPDNIVIKDSSFTIVRRENFCKEHERPTHFMWFQRADRISLIDTELIWESPDPEWQETSMFTDVRNLITRNCLLPELNR